MGAAVLEVELCHRLGRRVFLQATRQLQVAAFATRPGKPLNLPPSPLLLVMIAGMMDGLLSLRDQLTPR